MTKEQKINKQVEEQRQKVEKLSSRVSEIVDRIAGLEHDVGRFKQSVASEMKKIIKTGRSK